MPCGDENISFLSGNLKHPHPEKKNGRSEIRKLKVVWRKAIFNLQLKFLQQYSRMYIKLFFIIKVNTSLICEKDEKMRFQISRTTLQKEISIQIYIKILLSPSSYHTYSFKKKADNAHDMKKGIQFMKHNSAHNMSIAGGRWVREEGWKTIKNNVFQLFECFESSNGCFHDDKNSS